jgi:hypothetical protein
MTQSCPGVSRACSAARHSRTPPSLSVLQGWRVPASKIGFQGALPASDLENPMKLALLCAALVAAAAPSFADDLVARRGADTARLTDAACTNEQVLQQIQAQARPAFRAALVEVQGQTFQACWGTTGDAIYLLFEDGDEGLIPVNELKTELSA